MKPGKYNAEAGARHSVNNRRSLAVPLARICARALPAWLIGLTLLVTGCQQAGPAHDNDLQALRQLEPDLQAVSTPPPVPAVVMDSLLGNEIQLQRVRQGAERFDISVNEVPAKAFFLSLVAGTGTNVVVHPDVEGSLSLELKNVTVDDVLDVCRDVYGYEYRRSGDIYSVYPRKLTTAIFKVNYLDVQRVGVSDTNLSIGKVASDSNNNSSGDSAGSDDNKNLLNYLGNESGGEGVSPGARVQTLTKTDFWSSLQETILAMLGHEDGERMVMVNPMAGLVVVKALPRELYRVREFLEQSELSVKRQVILETKILEVRLSDDFKAGINWGAITGQLQLSKNVSEYTSPVDITTASESAGEIFASLVKIDDISTLLSLLETQGAVQVLSSPRVSTVNNQKAVIRVGNDEYFVTGVSTNTVSNASSTTSTPDLELSSFFSGIALDVTPQIGEDGDVILHIHPMVTNVTDQTKELTLGDSKFAIPLAVREVRESDSIVRARSGQVVVLGGLMQEGSAETKGKRPWLGDVPGLNTLFKTSQRSKTKTELVILMRPVVVDDQAWKDSVQGTYERLGNANNDYQQLFK